MNRLFCLLLASHFDSFTGGKKFSIPLRREIIAKSIKMSIEIVIDGKSKEKTIFKSFGSETSESEIVNTGSWEIDRFYFNELQQNTFFLIEKFPLRLFCVDKNLGAFIAHVIMAVKKQAPIIIHESVFSRNLVIDIFRTTKFNLY